MGIDMECHNVLSFVIAGGPRSNLVGKLRVCLKFKPLA